MARRGPGADAWGMNSPRISVVVVDDHAAVREGIRGLLEAEPDIELVAALADARAAVRLVRTRPSAVMVLDYHLPDEDGLSLCLRLKCGERPPRVVIYSAFADDSLAVRALVAGADAVLPKSSDPEDLSSAIRALAAGASHPARPSPSSLRSAGALLGSEDLPILGMLMQRTPATEIAEAMGTTEEWLTARRWAMLARLGGRRVRRDPAGAC